MRAKECVVRKVGEVSFLRQAVTCGANDVHHPRKIIIFDNEAGKQ